MAFFIKGVFGAGKSEVFMGEIREILFVYLS